IGSTVTELRLKPTSERAFLDGGPSLLDPRPRLSRASTPTRVPRRGPRVARQIDRFVHIQAVQARLEELPNKMCVDVQALERLLTARWRTLCVEGPRIDGTERSGGIYASSLPRGRSL